MDPMKKFDTLLPKLRAEAGNWSTALRIVAVNTFLYSIFGYINRHFYMPGNLVAEVEGRALRLIAPIPYASMAAFSHTVGLYGIRSRVRDLRLANVSSLLATYADVPGCGEAVLRSLKTRAAGKRTALTKSTLQLMHPADSVLAARGYFETTVGLTVDELWAREATRRARQPDANGQLIRKGERGKWAFAALCGGTQTLGERYLRERVEGQGFCADRLLSGLAALPKSVPQGHRWHLFKAHVRGHHTSERVHKALRTESVESCHFCGCGADSMAHLLDCATVRAALATVARDAHVPAPEWSLADVFLQRRMDGDRRSLMLASLAAVWSARRLASSGWDLRDPARLAEIVGREVRCPWLVACSATLCKKERRRARARKRPPDPRAVYYRFDGASRAQGIGGAGVAGWGAAVWPAGSGGEGPPAATVTGFLGRGVSNNISEYSGLRACLERAVRDTASNHPMHPVIFQGDSKLVMQQAAGECACRSPSLGELFDACRGLLRTLRARGVEVRLQHIFREFNTVADGLSNEAVDAPEDCGPRAGW